MRWSYGRALDDRPAARLATSVFQRRLASSTWALRRSLDRRAANFECRAAELAARRTALGSRRADDDDAKELEVVKRAQRAVRAERQRVLERIDRAPDRMTPGGDSLPRPRPRHSRRRRRRCAPDDCAEEIAVCIATGWEQERGARVQDVSRPGLARAAGLPDWPGFDLLAIRPATRPGASKSRAAPDAPPSV